METKTNESTTSNSTKPAAAKPAASKAKPAATAAKPAAAKTAPAKETAPASENNKSETGEGEKVHIFEKMIDFTYAATTSIPLGGKYVKKVFDQYETKEHAKNFSHRFFEPFFPFPKLKK